MGLGTMLLLGIGLTIAAFVAAQLWMIRKMKAMEGTAAPALPGLGDPEGRLVWFYGPNCGPCHAMRPAVDALGDKAIVVDVSQHMEAAMAYGVMATPTTVLVREGQIAAIRPGRLGTDQLEALLAS